MKIHVDNSNGLCGVKMSYSAKYTDNNGVRHKILTKSRDDKLREECKYVDSIYLIIPLE